jgi:DNA-directed RNA polymerase specialized sigma24 family protein
VGDTQDVDADAWWQSHLPAGSDPVIWEDLLPDERGAEPVEEQSHVEEREAILSSLAGVPTFDRIAFTLHTLDGYGFDEIAQIQERSVADVKNAVGAVRTRLLDACRRESLEAPES